MESRKLVGEEGLEQWTAERGFGAAEANGSLQSTGKKGSVLIGMIAKSSCVYVLQAVFLSVQKYSGILKTYGHYLLLQINISRSVYDLIRSILFPVLTFPVEMQIVFCNLLLLAGHIVVGGAFSFLKSLNSCFFFFLKIYIPQI